MRTARSDTKTRASSKAPSEPAPLFTLDTFKGADFRVEKLISRLAEPLLQAEPARRPVSATASADTAAAVSIATCDGLLEQFERRALPSCAAKGSRVLQR